jgi:signal peptidase II
LRIGLGLLWAGGAGNLCDRLRRGEVIDFMHLHVREVFHWATFNLADVYLTVGLALLIVDLLRPQTAHCAPPLAPTTS